MSARARRFAFAVLIAVMPASAAAQALWQPAAAPAVTAENEGWYQRGEPIIWGGAYYYPSGAKRHFDQYQMVRSGSYRGIPLYTDATLDPYGIVFVPLPGGLMQPYERRRDGALAGTTGNTIPGMPPATAVENAAGITNPVAPEVYTLPQAPGPFGLEHPYDTPMVIGRPTIIVNPAPVATTGRNEAPEAAAPVESAQRPRGVNGVWVTFQGRRWYANGPAISLSTRDFTKIGSYHGFAVYRWKGNTSVIYIPSADGLVAPYSLDKPTLEAGKGLKGGRL